MKALNNLSAIRKIDASCLESIISEFPGQCRQAAAAAGDFSLPPALKRKKYKNICFAGMGGSAIGAGLIKSYLAGELKIPLAVVRDYELPKFADKNTLLICISYSGNTEETLSVFSEAIKKKITVIAISSDGKLQRSASRKKIPFLKIPAGLPPRFALGHTFFSALVTLINLGLIKDRKRDITQTCLMLENLSYLLRPQTPHADNEAKKIAAVLNQKLPVIYIQAAWEPVAYRFRCQLAENSKMLSSHHVIPEMNHNEIVGWREPKKSLDRCVAVFLRDESEQPRVARRCSLSADILQKSGYNVMEIKSQGQSLLERMFSLIYIGDWVSYYLAILNKVDPAPVKRIDYFKTRLAKG